MALLSPREQQIARGLEEGLDNKTIADQLGTQTETVHAHLKHMFPKLGVHDRHQAVEKLFASRPPG